MSTSTEEIVLPLVSLGLIIAYHCFLVLRITHHPHLTIFGVSRATRKLWLSSMYRDRNDIVVVQSLRNWIMASSLLATVAVTISIGLTAFLGSGSTLFSEGQDRGLFLTKISVLLICLISAFLSFAQAIRYFNHTIFIVHQPKDREACLATLKSVDIIRNMVITPEFAGNILNRGAAFFTVGLRGFYLGFVATFWLLGAWFVFGASIVLVFILYFLDSTVDGLVKRSELEAVAHHGHGHGHGQQQNLGQHDGEGGSIGNPAPNSTIVDINKVH